MAANQRRKRLNSVSVLDSNPKEQSRLKKKLMSPQNDLNFKSHISLEWDGNKKSVVAKREQIGLSWRDLKQFVKPMLDRNILVDVFNISQEILKLENLKEVLSYEVWQNYLSENERRHLLQCLPGGLEKDEVVKTLLAGGNFHFGNPFLEWCASICSGNRHPDVVLCQEQSLQVNRNAYCLELQTYHNNMIGYLLRLKESCRNGEDSEKEIVEQIWRSKNDVDKRVCSQEKECRFDDLEDNVIATFESDSWGADDIACSSDNLNSSVTKRGGLTKRMSKKKLVGKRLGNSLIVSRDLFDVEGRAVQEESDGTKYMSYFKISKKQHELVKNIKQSGKSIHVTSLDQVLGNMSLFHVKPYQVFVEEEQKKLHEHWLQLVKTHLPVAYANRREIHFLRRKLRHSLAQELKNKQKNPGENVENHESLVQIWEDKHVSDDQSLLEDNKKYCHFPLNNRFLQHVSVDHEINPLDHDSDNYVTTTLDDTQLEQCGYSGNLKSRDVTANKVVAVSRDGDVWRARIHHSYFDSSGTHEYYSANNLSNVHSQVDEDQQTQSIAPESNICEKSLTIKQLEDDSFDKSELLHSLFVKRSDLNLQQSNGILAENGEYPEQFEKLSFPSLLPFRENRDGIYMQENVSENMYGDGGRYLIPRQDHLARVNTQNWDVGSDRMSNLLGIPSNAGNLSVPNWFSGEHQVCGGWTASSNVIPVPSQSIENDSLLGVLSQRNHSIGSVRSTCPTEQHIMPRSYETMGGVTRQAYNPFDYLGGREAAGPSIPEEMGWIGLPHHNSNFS